MRRILFMVLLALILSTPAQADRWFVLTAYDNEDPSHESTHSNDVQYIGPIHLSITFEWKPNIEPDIEGYSLYVADSMPGMFSLVEIEIKHTVFCTTLYCERSLSLEPITNIYLKEDSP